MGRPILASAALLALLLPVGIPVTRAAAQDGETDWAGLRREVEEAFSPLPVKAMFGDPEKELAISRRAPYTEAAREEIAKDRAALRLRRSRIADGRKAREDLLRRIGEAGGPAAAALLMDVYDRQQADIDAAQGVVDRFEEARRIDINPGVDPGGVYWERWMNGEWSDACNVLLAEQKVRDLALELLAGLSSPETREWMARHAAGSDRVEVREQLTAALAKPGSPEDAAALGAILRGERETWARVMILDEIARAKTAAAAPFVLDALADPAWPVRSAAVDAVRALGLRDAAALSALVGAMAASEGRVRKEVRDALSEATGLGLGLDPGEWRLWWESRKDGWPAPAEPSAVVPLEEPLPRLFGVPTASRRIAVLLSTGRTMLDPVKRRAEDNVGEPSPDPAVDTAYRIAVWELDQGLAALPDEAEFALLVFGDRVQAATKGLVRATKANRRKAVGLASRFSPDGSAAWYPALREALALGVPRGTEDLGLAGEGDVDTIFVITGKSGGAPRTAPPRGSLLDRVLRLRRVEIHYVSLTAIPTLMGEEEEK